MGQNNNFYMHVFDMNNKQRTRKRSSGVGTTMEGEFWSIFGVEY
jgi:hypothetical protein